MEAYGDIENVPSMDDLVETTQQVVSDSNALLVPTGPAWIRSNESHPEIDLFASLDGHTPSIQGVYLNAAILYALILERSPVGVEYHLTDILPDNAAADFFREQWKMTDEEIAMLQQIAWETVQEYQAATSTLENLPTAVPDLPGEILIPAGPFQKRCDEENPAESCRDVELPLHTVYLDTYYIDNYEATNARYKACVDAGACTAPTVPDSSSRDFYYGNPEYDEFPIVNVDWLQADALCAWEGKRLPTEAEWMKAARGPDDTRKHPWGDDTPTCDLVNYWEGMDGCFEDTLVVGSIPSGASSYGVMNMGGNVSEWVSDWYSNDYYSISPSENPTGPDTGTEKVCLGGDFIRANAKTRVSARIGYSALTHWFEMGFRCAHSP